MIRYLLACHPKLVLEGKKRKEMSHFFFARTAKLLTCERPFDSLIESPSSAMHEYIHQLWTGKSCWKEVKVLAHLLPLKTATLTRACIVNLCFFSLYGDYSYLIILPNLGEPNWCRIPRDHYQVQKEKQNFVVACLPSIESKKIGIFTP